MAETRATRVFVLANFEDSSLSTILRAPHYWLKGLVRCGCDVQTFNYRGLVRRSGLGQVKFLTRVFFKRRLRDTLLKQLAVYRPDIVFLPRDRLKDLDAGTAAEMRDVAPSATFVAIAHDWLPEIDPIRAGICRQMDIVCPTLAGEFLNLYKRLGIKCCAFIPNLCDPDIQYSYPVDGRWKTDIMFAGRTHNRLVPFNSERNEILARLAKMPNAKMYGCFDRPPVRGLDCFRAISGAQIALSINMVNNVRMYHSNRFINNIACGTFTLARRVPDSDLLFQDGVHVRYFDTVEEFFELAKWYLHHDEQRERIARAGMEHAHREFNCQRMARHLLDLVETGRIDAPWAETI